jgi:hypothetical protein
MTAKEKAEMLVEHIAVYHTRGSLEGCAEMFYKNVSRLSRSDLETIVYIMCLFDLETDKRYTVLADGEVIRKSTSGKAVIDFIKNRCSFNWAQAEVEPKYCYNGKRLSINIKEISE